MSPDAGPWAIEVREGTVYITWRGRLSAKYVGPLSNAFNNAQYLVTCANTGLAVREATDKIAKFEDAQLADGEVS